MKLIDQSIEIWNQDDMTYTGHIERCGRVCYQSDHLVKEGSDVKFTERIMNNGHTSVIEHYFVGFKIPTVANEEMIEQIKEDHYLFIYYRNNYEVEVYGNLRAWFNFIYKYPFNYRLRSTFGKLFPVILTDKSDLAPYHRITLSGQSKPITVSIITNRAIANELVRHRTMSYSQTSTRYCNFSNDKFNSELEFVRSADWDEIPSREKAKIKDLFRRIEVLYNASERKPQHNRDSLPLQLKTQLIMSGTQLMWQDVHRQRSSPAAHPMVRELMEMIMEKVDICK